MLSGLAWSSHGPPMVFPRSSHVFPIHIVRSGGISRLSRHPNLRPCQTLPGSHSSDLTLWIRDLQRRDQGDWNIEGSCLFFVAEEKKTILRNPQRPCCNLSMFQLFLEPGTASKPEDVTLTSSGYKKCFRPAFRRDGAEPADQSKQAGMEGTRRWACFYDIYWV